MKNFFQIGDTVKYSAAFLRSIQDTSAENANLRGVVRSIYTVKQAKFPIYRILWNGETEEKGCFANNLVRVVL